MGINTLVVVISKRDVHTAMRLEELCQSNFVKLPKESKKMEEYREKVLKAIREYEKEFNPSEQYEIVDALGYLYEIIRAIET